jgi:hypothetical protein
MEPRDEGWEENDMTRAGLQTMFSMTDPLGAEQATAEEECECERDVASRSDQLVS